MAYPTGSGSEILGRVGGTYDTADSVAIITVPSLHIYTILSASFCRPGATANTIKLFANNGSDRQLMEEDISDGRPFVWNDKLVLMGGDLLRLNLANTQEIKYWVSYIDQDWS